MVQVLIESQAKLDIKNNVNVDLLVAYMSLVQGFRHCTKGTLGLVKHVWQIWRITDH